MELGITGRVAYVAASTEGLGLAAARELAANGARVVVTGRRGDVAEAEARRIAEDFGVEALGLQVDILDAESRSRGIERAQEEWGPIDILILNGPGPRQGGALSIEPAEVVRAAETMIEPHVAMVQQVLPGMRERGWGRIVAIASRSIDAGSTWLALSAIGRTGLARYLQALAKEVAADGVTVNIAQPGTIATARIDQLDEAESAQTGVPAAEVRKRREAQVPMGRLGDPAELAAVIAFFASEPARYVTGQSLQADGGLYAAD